MLRFDDVSVRDYDKTLDDLIQYLQTNLSETFFIVKYFAYSIMLTFFSDFLTKLWLNRELWNFYFRQIQKWYFALVFVAVAPSGWSSVQSSEQTVDQIVFKDFGAGWSWNAGTSGTRRRCWNDQNIFWIQFVRSTQYRQCPYNPRGEDKFSTKFKLQPFLLTFFNLKKRNKKLNFLLAFKYFQSV